jgi:hypothetical protein
MCLACASTSSQQCWEWRAVNVVRWCLICCASKHVRPHRWWVDNGSRISYCCFMEAEVEHEEFDWERISWRQWYDANHALDSLFPVVQGYGIIENLLLQDNKSLTLLEQNGKASSGKRTRHINIRYFFITDLVNMKEISIGWYPTKKMVADFMTKSLQGSHFRN